MFKKYAYKIVKGELIFNNSEDAEKIDELINEWHNAIIKYANMYAKLERFIEIPTRLPESLKKTAKEYAETLVKQNGKHCIFTNSKKAKEIKEDIEKKIKNAENIVSKKAIKHLEKKKIVAINNNFIKLERNYVRTNDEFKTVIITTLEKYKTINAWFRCKRKQLLIEALNSPKINNKTKGRRTIEVCNPLIKKQDNRYFLIFPIRKLVKLSTIEELSNELDESFNILSIDINLDDVCYAIYKVNNNNYKRIFIDRIKWNIAEWLRVKQIDAYAKERYRTPAKRLERKLKLKNLGICQRISNEVVKNALKYNVKAIIYEDLSNNFKNRSKELNFKIRRWFYRKILNYLINSANWNRISTIYVDPQNTSKTCPKCNNELEKDKNFNDLHHFECKNCGFKDDRDYIAVTNITKKFLMKLWEIRARLFLGFGMNKDQSLEREGLRTQPKTFLQAR
ncbi:MAG: transposase [Candidatus Methanomethylicaceae archaeon]